MEQENKREHKPFNDEAQMLEYTYIEKDGKRYFAKTKKRKGLKCIMVKFKEWLYDENKTKKEIIEIMKDKYGIQNVKQTDFVFIESYISILHTRTDIFDNKKDTK